MPDANDTSAFSGGLTVDRPPHWRARESADRIFQTAAYAAAPAVLAAWTFFGWRGLGVILLATVTAVTTDWAFSELAGRAPSARHGGRAHSVLMGVLLGLTLPPTVQWYVPAVGAVAMIVVGKGLFGGLGHYVFHPALVGRLAVLLIFPGQLAPTDWRILNRGHVLLGDLGNDLAAGPFGSWFSAPLVGSADALRLPHPLSSVGQMVAGRAEWIGQAIGAAGENLAPGEQANVAGAVLYRALWDRMPPLADAVAGAIPGDLGATCAVALILVGLVLMMQGWLRWQLPLAFLAAAAGAAAVCPLRIGGLDHGVAAAWQWLPGLLSYQNMPVGPLYVVYHLMGGELLLAAFLLAGDLVSRPMTARGQALFGLGCGVLAILLRLYLVPLAGAYIAILVMNLLTPLIDRITQPRAFGH